MSAWLELGLAVFLVAANAFFVAAEFAIVKVRATRLEELEKRGKAGARIALSITRNLDAYLSAAQVGITLASLGLGWIGEPALARLLDPALHAIGISPRFLHTISFALAFSMLTAVHIVLGEQAPKLMALSRAESITLLVAWPMRAFYYLLFPFIWLLSASTKHVLGAFGLKDVSEQDGQPGYSEEELRLLLARAGTAGLMDEESVKVAQRALAFPSRTARHIMVPRSQVTYFAAEQTLAEAIDVAYEAGHTRYPVVGERGDLDDTVGIVNIKDVLHSSHENASGTVGKLAKRPLYVPESITAPKILQALYAHGTQMAVVVDEHGGTAGVITLADVVMEIVGPLPQEGESRLSQVPESAEWIEGNYPLAELIERIGVTLDGKQPATVAGYLMQVLEKIPRTGDRTMLGEHSLIVEQMEGPRVARIRVVPALPSRPSSLG